MDADEQLYRLKRRLDWQSAGPLMSFTDQTMTFVWRLLRQLVQSLRKAGEERPLSTLLIAIQAGFSFGLWRSHRAKH